MRITMTNAEIENFLNVISDKDSFRNNISIKLPTDLNWALRVNTKIISDRFIIYKEALNELGQEYINAGKTNKAKTFVKDEFLSEYNERIMALKTQQNELDIIPIKLNDFKNIDFSAPEYNLLMSMVDIDAEMKADADKTVE